MKKVLLIMLAIMVGTIILARLCTYFYIPSMIAFVVFVGYLVKKEPSFKERKEK